MSVLETAQKLVHGDRGAVYGHPLENHSTTADMFHAFMAKKYGVACGAVSAEDVCIFNMLQKIARLANTPGHVDSLVDIAGYAENYKMILDKRQNERSVPEDWADT